MTGEQLNVGTNTLGRAQAACLPRPPAVCVHTYMCATSKVLRGPVTRVDTA
ncbi:MAG TPA: hypothetical protein VEX18_08245 [Polyangiaceae bacterium]|nr:hypothetical protein [Polyangiaceae bacterium]